MILARLSKAIREQNWFAVVLEFVIVIAGVVIGFQITAGAERAAAEDRMDRALVRLQVEIEQSAGMLDGLVTAYQGLNTARTEAIERLLARDFDGMDEDRLASGVVAISLYPAFSPQQGVYEEIVSSGMLSSLGGDNADGEALRNAVSRYQREVAFLQGQIDYMRASSLSDRSMVEFPSVQLEYTPGTARERAFVVDWQAAAGDAELMQALLQGNNRMRATTDWWDDTRQAAFDLCEALAQHTGRPCTIVTEMVE